MMPLGNEKRYRLSRKRLSSVKNKLSKKKLIRASGKKVTRRRMFISALSFLSLSLKQDARLHANTRRYPHAFSARESPGPQGHSSSQRRHFQVDPDATGTEQCDAQ
jgi:hypothetical protein